MTRPKALISWSSGKDSAFALHEIRREGAFDVVGALTTVNERFGRVSIHGVRQQVLDAQLVAAELPPLVVPIPDPCPNDAYEARMTRAMADAKRSGITHIIFGDLFLADIRAYREQKLAGTGIAPVFPLWGRPSSPLAREIIASGLEARLVSVDRAKLDRSFAGRTFDQRLLEDLPAGIDPCGENGEFHTFVTAAPTFPQRIDIVCGDIVERGGFAYCDLMLAE
ncbi:ATP-binding protein [Nitrobacter sp.]|uniref:Dph6-related ATP pyrophosphatase n=1 Tax=unclassified Nitrobacter TaxID=2620411 RepID=UPI002BD5A6F8|nr:adenine nucleotide alpha hydrolase [Nitrobacter sp.]